MVSDDPSTSTSDYDEKSGKTSNMAVSGNAAENEMTIECVAALYTTRSFIPVFVQKKPLLIFSIISSMLPPIADIMLDFINGARALSGNNISLASRSISWAMLINVIITPMISVWIFNFDKSCSCYQIFKYIYMFNFKQIII